MKYRQIEKFNSWCFMTEPNYGLSKILYIIPGFVLLSLFIGSISKLFNFVIFPMEPGFFLEAVKEFRANPTIIPILFIVIFGFYLVLGFYSFSEKHRNRTKASAALGALSISIILGLYAFWNLIKLVPILFFEPFILIGLLLVSYRVMPWDEALRTKISLRLNEVNNIINDYSKIIDDFKLERDLNLRIFDELRKYGEEINKIKTRIESNNSNLKLADLNSERALKLLKSLKSVDTEENIIDVDKKIIKTDFIKYINTFKDKQIVDRILNHYLSEESRKYWNDNRNEFTGEVYE